MPLSIGAKIGHYEVLSLLGQGGMGEVYRARDTKLKRDVALKIVPATFLRDPERMARFQREAQVLASLDPPNDQAPLALPRSESQSPVANTRAVLAAETGSYTWQRVPAMCQHTAPGT